MPSDDTSLVSVFLSYPYTLEQLDLFEQEITVNHRLLIEAIHETRARLLQTCEPEATQ